MRAAVDGAAGLVTPAPQGSESTHCSRAPLKSTRVHPQFKKQPQPLGQASSTCSMLMLDSWMPARLMGAACAHTWQSVLRT